MSGMMLGIIACTMSAGGLLFILLGIKEGKRPRKAVIQGLFILSCVSLFICMLLYIDIATNAFLDRLLDYQLAIGRIEQILQQ